MAIWKLLCDEPRPVVPYASLLPNGRNLRDYSESLVAKVLSAKALGFRAAKLEVCVNGPYSHNGLQEDNAAIVEIVAECRRVVGPEMVLMIDVAYAWPDPATALGVTWPPQRRTAHTSSSCRSNSLSPPAARVVG